MNYITRIYKKLMDPKYHSVRLTITYLSLTALVTGILFWRFPNNVSFPNFYGEDGSVYLQNILDKGWLEGAITPFNGYSIIGLYLLEAFGWFINAVFMDGSLLSLPQSFALIASIFMAAVISLPYLLFRSTYGRFKMFIVVLFGAMLPLPVSPHLVIGTIGNQKWIFLYLAFLMIIYRMLHYKKLSTVKLLAIDSIILVSAYTNATVYLLIPLAFIPYLHTVRKNRLFIKKSVHELLHRNEVKSLLLVALLLTPQLLYVAINGVPKLTGYLDSAFNPDRLIEILNRTYLFGITHFVNGALNDIAVILLLGILLYGGKKILRGADRLVFFSGMYSAGCATLLFVINRPGVSDHFNKYNAAGSGPDQFFYAQTLVMYLSFIILITALSNKFKIRIWGHVLFTLLAGFILISGFASNAYHGQMWRNFSPLENDAGTFIDQSIKSCVKQHSDKINVTVYPYISGQFYIEVPRGQVCSPKLATYQPSVQDLGLRINNNDHFAITRDGQFSQTFIASQNGLNGIRLFVSNFGQFNRGAAYYLYLRDGKCMEVLRYAKIPNVLVDNSYYNARFDPITNSKNIKYCFTIDYPSSSIPDPIALQRSESNIYLQGVFKEDVITSNKDIVFTVLFEKIK